MAGKGDTYRPVNRKAYDENYERIFRQEEPHAPTSITTECEFSSVCSCGGHCEAFPPSASAETVVGPREETR